MFALIIVTTISVIILLMGVFDIRLPFLGDAQTSDIKARKLSVPHAPVKKPGIFVNMNTENEKSHFRFIKSHIRHYHLRSSDVSIH